jgi:hypothetical protein
VHLKSANMLSRIQSVALPRLPPLPKLPPLLPPLQDMREAVEKDVRGLWAGMDALRLHELSAANEPTYVPEPPVTATVARAWRPPLGWVSLAAAGALFAALGFAQIEVQHRLAPTAQPVQQPRPATRKHKKLRRVRPPERTDYSRGT